MYKWGKSSVKNINTVNDVLQILAQKLILLSPYDLSVLNTGGLRTAEMQLEIFIAGHSKCNGRDIKSYHQSGLAIDFVPYVNGKLSWSSGLAFLTVARAALAIWEDMTDSGENEGYYLYWGGFWGAKDLDGDGFLEVDEKLGWDMAHFELRKSPQKKTFKIKV